MGEKIYNPTPRIQLSVRSFVPIFDMHRTNMHHTHVRCYHHHTASAPKGRKGRCHAGPKGHKLEVEARRAPKFLSTIIWV